MHAKAVQVLAEEGAAHVARGQDAVVAVEAAPLGEVVCDVKGGGGGGRVFVVYEGDGGRGFVFLGAAGCAGAAGGGGGRGRGLNDYVTAEEVAMGEDEGVCAADAGGAAQLGDEPVELSLEGVAAVELLVGACGQLADPALHRGPDIGDGFSGR